MSTTDVSNITVGGGAPGPGGGGGAGPGGGSNATTCSGEPIKIIKTQLIPHSQPASLQQQTHPPLPSPATPTSSSCTTITNNNNPQLLHAHAPLHLKNTTNVTNLFSLNPVAAKITHVKTTTMDVANNSGLTLSGLSQPPNVGGPSGTGTIVTSSGLSTMGAIKVGNSGALATSLSGPLTLNTSQTNTSGATSIRAIGAGGQSTQVRVVMGNIMTPSMIKQLENSAPGRTQITAFPTAPVRTVSNTSITVTRTATQATYLPRASVTATQMTGVGVGVPAGQRVVTPMRTTPASVTATAAGGSVTGITATGNFVRGTAVSRNTSSPSTTVISPATSTTWMAANPTGQVQLIRAIPHQSRQRIITTQGITASPVSASGSVATISGTVVTSTVSALQTGGINNQQQVNNSQNQGQSTLQTISSANAQQQQQTYVATVLPPRHPATLVYSSNVATTQSLSQHQPQFNQTCVGATGPRFAVAPLTGGTAVSAGAPRQIRPIPFAKSFSAAKLNTTSISIRAPNITPSMATGVSNASVCNTNANSPRSSTITGVTSAANVLPSTNLSAARIIQLQQPSGTAQQIIGATGRIAANVMLQPIIVNTSGANKIGIRPPATMAAKVQPSLTITQLGIGKLPSLAGGGPPTLGQQGTVSNSPSISTPSITAANITTNASTTQLVNVSQGGQLLTTQNMVTSTAGGTAAGGATVVPLAISGRTTGASGNILTGTMTPIKNANAITLGKVITQSQLAPSSPMESNISNSSNNTSSSGPTNVFIHHTAPPQRSLNNSSINSGINTSQSAINVSNAVCTNVLTSTGNVSTGTFLQPGSTIYYESVPASSVQVSTGVLSLTTTTVTNSTISQNQIANTAANLSISSLPFATHSGGQSTTATFTVVPSTGGRTIGQLQIPVSNSGSQIQAVPVRFSQLNTANITTAASDTISVSHSTPQLLQSNTGSTVVGGGETSQIIIPASMAQQSGNSVNSINTQQQTHQMVIPLQTSIKVTSGCSSTNSAVVPNFLRKRDAEGSPVRAAKNLQPTFLSMPSNTLPTSSSVGSSYSLPPITSCTMNSTSTFVTEALGKKDRSNASYSSSSSSSSNLNNNIITQSKILNRPSRTESPASSDGSTTVSANSSPGVEQQIQDNNMIINRLPGGIGPMADSHFNPINELYSNHHSVVPPQHIMSGTPVTSRNLAVMDHLHLHQQQQHHHVGGSALPPITIQQRLNGGVIDCALTKKSRRSTNDSQLSTQSQTSLTLPPPQANSVVSAATNPPPSSQSHEYTVLTNGTTAVNVGGTNEVLNGKENSKPVAFILKRPRNCTLMSTYKQSWKSAYNHFQRYSDVKPREERRPTIMDLANQTNVLGKINGWKIYHLKSQMEDLCENESLGYEKLSSMLKQIETNGIKNETERVSDLLKGNMQRSKIIIDGVIDAQNQIMKIFEHKSHVSDIINRCASKRNYKKREKI